MAENNSSAPLKTAEGAYSAGNGAKALAAQRAQQREGQPAPKEAP